MAVTWNCSYGDCASGGKLDRGTETHWRFPEGDPSLVWPICAKCSPRSRDADDSLERENNHGRRITHLHLPIVQPVVGSEQAIAMEVALHAACRLLRIGKGDDEAEQTLALLRQAQAEAWDRVHGRAA